MIACIHIIFMMFSCCELDKNTARSPNNTLTHISQLETQNNLTFQNKNTMNTTLHKFIFFDADSLCSLQNKCQRTKDCFNNPNVNQTKTQRSVVSDGHEICHHVFRNKLGGRKK